MWGGGGGACQIQVKTPRPCGKGLRGCSLAQAVSSSSKTEAGRSQLETEGQGRIMQPDALSDSARLTDAEWQRVYSTGASERTANKVFLFAGYYLWKPWLRPTEIRWKIGFTIQRYSCLQCQQENCITGLTVYHILCHSCHAVIVTVYFGASSLYVGKCHTHIGYLTSVGQYIWYLQYNFAGNIKLHKILNMRW